MSTSKTGIEPSRTLPVQSQNSKARHPREHFASSMRTRSSRSISPRELEDRLPVKAHGVSTPKENQQATKLQPVEEIHTSQESEIHSQGYSASIHTGVHTPHQPPEPAVKISTTRDQVEQTTNTMDFPKSTNINLQKFAYGGSPPV